MNINLRPGLPLLTASVRRRTGFLLAGCVIVVVVLGVLFARQTTPDRLDRAIDSPIINALRDHQVLAAWLALPGTNIAAVVVSAVFILICLRTGRLNGIVLAAAAVPAAIGLNDGLIKHVVDRTYLGVLSYPSGHATAFFALASTAIVLFAARPPAVDAKPVGVLISAAACVIAVAVAIGVIALRFHYFTDTVGGAALGIGTVCVLALVLDLPLVRRCLAWACRQPAEQVPVPERATSSG